MNIFVGSFFKADESWHFIEKIYLAEYESDARENAERDWKDNYQGWKMSFKKVPHYDSYHSAKIVEFNK